MTKIYCTYCKTPTHADTSCPYQLKEKTMTTAEDTTKTTADITTTNIADSRFNRFDDEFIDKWFNEQGKQAIQDYITLHTQRAETKARIDGAEMLHKRVFSHFDLLPKIQQKNGTTHSEVFNEQNYQAVACEFIAQLTPKENK